MPVRTLACVGLLLATAVPATPLWAQRTGDQARLIFSVSAGAVGGKALWAVGKQPVQFTVPADTFALSRVIRSTIVIGFAGSYFPGEHLGLGAEGFLIGLGYEDSCRHLFMSGSPNVAAVCQSLQGASKAATAVILSAGPLLRVNSRKLISPYVRANVGLVFSNQSSLRTIGRYPTSQGNVELIVYSDNHDSRVEPSLILGGGFTAALSPGYQLRWEIRDNIAGVQKVRGPAAQAGDIPPHSVDYKHLLSITIGFDVVLERRRGRRY